MNIRSYVAGGFAPLLLLLPGASEAPKEVVVWPGMAVTEFNRLNGLHRKMKEHGSDWIGVNSPVTLILRHERGSISFPGNRMGGGVQIASSDLTTDAKYETPARVRSIAFNIGGGMEDIAEQMPLLVDRCDELARMAGVEPKPVPDAGALRRSLEIAGELRDLVEICGGEGVATVFQIVAFHNKDNSQYGGNYGRAYLDGYVGTR